MINTGGFYICLCIFFLPVNIIISLSCIPLFVFPTNSSFQKEICLEYELSDVITYYQETMLLCFKNMHISGHTDP